MLVELHEDAGASLIRMDTRDGRISPSAAVALEATRGTEGTRAVIVEQHGRFSVDDAGVMQCPGAFTVDAVTWTRAVTNDTCHGHMIAGGYPHPRPCNDVKGCQSAEGLGPGLVVGLLLPFRRRRRRK